MSSTIKSLVSGRIMDIASSYTDPTRIYLSIEGDGASGAITIDRADLLAALRTEGILPAEPKSLAEWERELLNNGRYVPDDAVVILRETLPPVEAVPTGKSTLEVDGEHWSVGTPESHRETGRAHFAVAEFLDAVAAHPPVDAEQVEAMSEVLRGEHAWGRKASDDMARALYLAGARIEAAK